MTKLKTNPEFYKSLAHLFYALVLADRHVEMVEKLAVHGLIRKEWSQESEGLDIEEIFYSTLKKLFQGTYEKEDAFSVFKNFFLKNQSGFSMEVKRHIMDSANKIVSSFSGINKSESIMISRLYFLMNLSD
ncbi:hypothetical protein [Roseivirga sp.]|uniref:hypothetical protein n=1 Tax=Roseivirga sp. TaxID=1964215 RepID=UPI003B5272DF